MNGTKDDLEVIGRGPSGCVVPALPLRAWRELTPRVPVLLREYWPAKPSTQEPALQEFDVDEAHHVGVRVVRNASPDPGGYGTGSKMELGIPEVSPRRKFWKPSPLLSLSDDLTSTLARALRLRRKV